MSTARDLMTSPVHTVGPDAGPRDVARLLLQCQVSALPVVHRHGAVIGVVSEADLLAPIATPGLHGLGRVPAARDLMTSPAITVPPEATAAEMAWLMHRHGVKRLPVVDAQGRPVGIVTRMDLLRTFLRPDDAIRADARRLVPSGPELEVRGGVITLHGSMGSGRTAERLLEALEDIDGVVAVQSAPGRTS